MYPSEEDVCQDFSEIALRRKARADMAVLLRFSWKHVIMLFLMASNPIPESLDEPARLWSISRLSALPIMAVAGMVLMQIGFYGATFLYIIHFKSGHPLPDVLVASPTLGMALGALMLPPAILLILRRNRGGGTLLRRCAVFLPLAAIFAVCLVLRRPGDGEWEYGTIRVFLVTMGARGIIASGMVMLFFTVIPKGCRGFWCGCALSTGFVCWEIVQALVPETETLADAVSLYNSVFGAQTVVYCVLAAIVVLGFAMRPAPEEKPTAAEPEKRGRTRRLAGTLFLFYAANGFMQMRLFRVGESECGTRVVGDARIGFSRVSDLRAVP